MNPKIFVLLLALRAFAGVSWGGQSPLILPLWEGHPPGFVSDAGPEKAFNEVTVMNVSVPSMAIYLPPRKKANGMAIVYCSGGSYNKVSYISDAVGNADYFVSRGIALMVVKYRTQPPATDGKAALDDARRAMRIVRHRAGEWGIDPARIGMLGGSAGANLVLRLFTSGFRGDENAADAVERESCRPAFAGLLCPWPAAQQVADFPVTKDTPPMFLCSARDDTVAPTAFAEGIAQACEKAGVPACRLWIIERGGHAAFRLDSKGEGGQWADRFTAWLRENTFDKGAAKHALQREARLGAGGTTSLSFVDDRNGFLLASSDPAAGLMTKNIYATTDGGATWQPRPSPDAHSYYATGIAFRSSAEGWITGTYHGGDACPLYHTRNGAGSWALQKLPIPDEYRGGYADSYPPVFIGEDRGHGYLPVKLVRHDPPPGHWAWVNYESDDGGATWHLPAAGVASLTEP